MVLDPESLFFLKPGMCSLLFPPHSFFSSNLPDFDLNNKILVLLSHLLSLLMPLSPYSVTYMHNPHLYCAANNLHFLVKAAQHLSVSAPSLPYTFPLDHNKSD